MIFKSNLRQIRIMINHFNNNLYKIEIFILNTNYRFLYCYLFINILLKKTFILYK